MYAPINIPKPVGFKGVSCDTWISSTADPIFSFDRLIWQSKQTTAAVPKGGYKTELISQILEKGPVNGLLIVCYGSLVAILDLNPYSWLLKNCKRLAAKLLYNIS